MGGQDKKRSPLHWNIVGTTTFYPKYGEGRDVVEPVMPIRPAKFQRIIPRYELSASQTRDEGVGPVFEEVIYRAPVFRRCRPAVVNKNTPQLVRKKPRRKIRTDFSA